MHEHDPDLITALAEERLDDQAARQAEDSLADCPRCLDDLRALRAALAALRAADPPRLTDLERARLRRGVAAALGLPTRRSPGARLASLPWGAVAAAAAVLAGVVLLGPVLTRGGLIGQPASTPEFAREAAPEATAAPDTAPAATTTVASEAQGEAQLFQAAPFTPRHLGQVGTMTPEGLRRLVDDAAFQALAGSTRRDVEELRARADASELAGLPCYREGYALSDRNLVAVVAATGTFEGRPAVAYAYASSSGQQPDAPLDRRALWVLATDDCRILHSQ